MKYTPKLELNISTFRGALPFIPVTFVRIIEKIKALRSKNEVPLSTQN